MTAAAQLVDARTSRRIGTHSDAVTIPADATQFVRSGTSGLRPDGTLPEDFAEEAGQASDNVCEALRRVGAGLSDVGLVRSWFADRDGQRRLRKGSQGRHQSPTGEYARIGATTDPAQSLPGGRSHRGRDALRGGAAE
ncbi:hypothetical protein OG894_03215 [Streptomyces sp. NBC_01724]|uniref:hypothetical protein n=1 Tax=unclassified Streptomyces TaxID=2593676 RepID=UPI002E35FE88|nr:hypothetical protein [Streptomyces sp. NBC_01724]WTE56244.1 hypothetical protein OG987_39495 [Streptomyces sp. NBC_01620]WTE64318.1 hypothetical protein OG784_39235 [Streptomyces sp. NBC_01617]WTI91603.1 hypothetical protein OHB17_38550 [Streptomyces sp. NBC_00724]